MKTTTLLLHIAIAGLTFTSLHANEAKTTYEQLCAKCHGADGKGETRTGKKLGAKDYSDPKVQADLKDDRAFKAVREGLKREEKTLMRSEEKLTDDQIRALITYMRTFGK